MRNKAETNSSKTRVIKKYPNRRLYDTDSSSYVTLADIKQLVMKGQAFVVRDAKTDADLTRSILLQIILEEEAGGAPIFSEAALSNIIRFYGNTMQGFMGNVMEQNVQAMMNLQTQLADQMRGKSPETWAEMLSQQSPLMQQMTGNYLEQSRNALLKMQEQFQKQTTQMLGAFGLKSS